MGVNNAVKCCCEYSSLANVHYLLSSLTSRVGEPAHCRAGSPGLSFALTRNSCVMPISSNPASSPAKSQGNSEEQMIQGLIVIGQGLASCKGTLLQFIKVRSSSSLLSIGCCGPDAAKETNNVLWQP